MARCVPLLLLVALLLPASPARAALQVLASPRVKVLADSEPVGPREGFLTLHVRAENLTGSAQRVSLRFESVPLVVARATLELAGAEKRSLDLLVPAYARFGQLIASDGHDQGRESFNWHWQSRDPVLLEGATAGAELVARSRGEDGTPTAFAAAVAVSREQLPVTLAPLAGYAAVGVLEAPFTELSEPQRGALLAYAATGGELYLAALPPHPEALLPLWADGPAAEGAHPYGLGHVHLYASGARCAQALGEASDLKRAGSTSSHDGWRSGADPLMDVARVPVGGFLALVLAFVLVLGPGSFALRARRGPGVLVVFIPLTAMATCGGIAGYGLMHEGLFTVHASSRAVTFLDSARHRAATQSVDGFYASLAPSAVRFGALAAFVPPSSAPGTSLELDLGSGLTARGGFIPSRSYREHLIVAEAPSRARLSVRGGGPEGMAVENALGATVVDGAFRLRGQLCTFASLADGAAGPYACTEGEELPFEMRQRLELGLNPRFDTTLLAASALAPLKEGEFLASLGRAVFAPELGLKPERSGDFQLVRGRLSP